MYDIRFFAGGTADTEISFEAVNAAFILGIPEQSLKEAEQRGINADFFTKLHTPAFYNHASLAALEKSSGIKRLEERITDKSVEIARKFMNAIEIKSASGARLPTNGLKHGVSTIDLSGRNVTLGLHDSDYFTSQVMDSVFSDLRNAKEPLVADDRLEEIFEPKQHDLRFLFNSLGLNISVVAGERYIVGMRPNGERHVAMNEGLNRRDEAPDFTRWYKGGMKNELGIEDADVQDLSHASLFMVPSVAQMGIHAVAHLPEGPEALRTKHRRARDAWENAKLSDVPFTAEQMRDMADSRVPTIGYTRGLWDHLVRTYAFKRT